MGVTYLLPVIGTLLHINFRKNFNKIKKILVTSFVGGYFLKKGLARYP